MAFMRRSQRSNQRLLLFDIRNPLLFFRSRVQRVWSRANQLQSVFLLLRICVVAAKQSPPPLLAIPGRHLGSASSEA